MLFTLSVVNLGVAVFNLVPGLPLDGGRILRAAIWRRTGSFVRATRVAAIGGRVVAAMLVAVGIGVSLAGDAGGALVRADGGRSSGSWRARPAGRRRRSRAVR